MTVDRSKLGKKSRTKGVNFERKVVRQLKKYTGDLWSRVPYSGAGYEEGDIKRLKPKKFPLVIECKNRKDLTLDKIFRRPEILKQYVSSHQILIFNNRGQILVVYPSTLLRVYISKIHAIIEIDNEIYYMEPLKDFCEEITDEEI